MCAHVTLQTGAISGQERAVPATGIFQDELGLETITLGWGLPGSKAHAPNEWYTISAHLKWREGYALLLDKLAK